jgi:hypothetical protein
MYQKMQSTGNVKIFKKHLKNKNAECFLPTSTCDEKAIKINTRILYLSK